MSCLAFVLSFAAVLVPSRMTWSKNPGDDISQIGKRRVAYRTIISEEKERAIGKQCATDFEQREGFVSDHVIVEYIQRVTENITHNSDLRLLPTIRVIDSPEVVAFTFPGGFLYISSGLISSLDEEGQLAGVLAHQVAHLAVRHWASMATKAALLQSSTPPALGNSKSPPATSLCLPSSVCPIAHGTASLFSYGVPMLFLSFRRRAEVEADYLGLQYMYKAGYDPNSYITYLSYLEKEEQSAPNRTPLAFRACPPATALITAAEKEIKKILPAHGQSVVTTSEFDDIKARLQTIAIRLH